MSNTQLPEERKKIVCNRVFCVDQIGKSNSNVFRFQDSILK